MISFADAILDLTDRVEVLPRPALAGAVLRVRNAGCGSSASWTLNDTQAIALMRQLEARYASNVIPIHTAEPVRVEQHSKGSVG